MKYYFHMRVICNGDVNDRCVINTFFNSQIEECQVQTECFLHKLILLCDSALVLSNNLGFSREELEAFINDICTK